MKDRPPSGIAPLPPLLIIITILTLSAHDELGMCRTSLVSTMQSVLCILVRSLPFLPYTHNLQGEQEKSSLRFWAIIQRASIGGSL